MRAHYRGERIPSPRNHSAPLTQFRHETGSTHSLLLQRGGFWGAVDAVQKWSKRRNQLVYAQRKATEGTDKALGVQDRALVVCQRVQAPRVAFELFACSEQSTRPRREMARAAAAGG